MAAGETHLWPPSAADCTQCAAHKQIEICQLEQRKDAPYHGKRERDVDDGGHKGKKEYDEHL